jgi:hypothetical protein
LANYIKIDKIRVVNYLTGKVSLRLMAKRTDNMLTVKEAAAKIGSPEASI